MLISMSTIFTYLPDATPLSNSVFTKSSLESSLLKKNSDILEDNNDYHSITKKLSSLLAVAPNPYQEIVEFYRKDFRSDLDFYCNGYLWYLIAACMHGLGIEVSPWYFWDVILHEICKIVKYGEEKCRLLFTPTDETTNLSFDTIEIDIGVFTEKVRKMMPDPNIYDKFFPAWPAEKLPQFYVESLQGLFEDMVERSYDCNIVGCSCPKVRVLGDQKDWTLLARATAEFYDIFRPFGESEYLQKLVSYTAKLENIWNQPDTWRKFFMIEASELAREQEPVGEFQRLINIGSMCLVDELPSTLSRFPFENLSVDPEKGNSYFLAGIIGGNADSEGILVPVYDYAITFIDRNKLQLTEESKASMEKYIEISTNLDRLTAKSIRNHLEITENFDSSYGFILKPFELRILQIEDEKEREIKLLKLYEDTVLNIHELSGKQITINEAQEDFNKRRANGTSEEYCQKLERERLESITNNYSIWFRGINNIHDENKGKYINATITLQMYLDQLEEAKHYYECISTPEKLRPNSIL